MSGVDVLGAQLSDVPEMAVQRGVPPSKRSGSSLACDARTAAVCGTLVAMAASRACDVPAMEALTFSLSLSSGIFAKSAGSALAATKLHGPASFGARNQRPE